MELASILIINRAQLVNPPQFKSPLPAGQQKLAAPARAAQIPDTAPTFTDLRAIRVIALHFKHIRRRLFETSVLFKQDQLTSASYLSLYLAF